MPPPAPLLLPAARLVGVVAASGGRGGGASPSRPPLRRARRGKSGFSRQSAIKKSFHQEQVAFATPVPADPTVAVIGGGASGLACASALAAHGVRAVVFDTGMHGLAGRMATRAVGGEQLVFDHAAQFFTATDERFQKLVDAWVDRGLRLELSSVWALLAAFEDPLPIPQSDSHGVLEGAFENIPKVTAEKVKEDMLGGVELALGLSKGSLQQPMYTRVQLWGAALPMNTPGVPCIFDPLGRAGICGDWLTGSSIEAAVFSGSSLANHIADYFASNGERTEEFAIGLHENLNRVEGHDIGQFPGLDFQKPQVVDVQLTPSL
ncbi:hypothetical protein PR202_gb24137 [Eleusine coracana subsp. coracana]|uniref:Uncharacterized protein n=1 Tax=Eleusine coracana subsp. coracana TaxID=191504 RepID=A0AAV5FI36_ELECO|nr:hypothetical protein PR202_gb24137 [Eleusine coracana subsp. coracana]